MGDFKGNAYWFVFAIFCMTSGCSAFEGEQKTNVNEIIKTQKIKQLSQADVVQVAELFGEKLLVKIYEAVGQSDSTEYASVLDSLAITFDGKITVGVVADDFLMSEEKKLLEAYQYNQEQNIKITNAIQMLDSKTALYSVPFFEYIPNSTQIEKDSTLVMLSIVYPVKSAINYMD